MSTRTIHLGKSLPELGPELDQAWRTWLAQHGLPGPDEIPARGAITVDDDARTITVERLICDERGHPQFDGQDFLREIVTVQLEAPALPIPGGFPIEVES